MLTDLHADWSRHGRRILNPSLWMLAVYRYGRWVGERPKPLRWIGGKLYGALNLAVELSTGSSLPREAKIGDAIHFVHYFDIRIHPDAVIGDRVGIMHDVTLGTTMKRDGAPKIGNDVFIGTGAKILGPVSVGDGAIIAPNSVVLTDVPAGCTAIGVPARVLRLNGIAAQAEEAPQPEPSKVTDITEAAALRANRSARSGS
jgi:serine O-acetyltransferase